MRLRQQETGVPVLTLNEADAESAGVGTLKLLEFHSLKQTVSIESLLFNDVLWFT